MGAMYIDVRRCAEVFLASGQVAADADVCACTSSRGDMNSEKGMWLKSFHGRNDMKQYGMVFMFTNVMSSGRFIVNETYALQT